MSRLKEELLLESLLITKTLYKLRYLPTYLSSSLPISIGVIN